MKLYRISQSANKGWDTFDSAIVAAPDEETARRCHPSSDREWDADRQAWVVVDRDGSRHPDPLDSWAPSPSVVTVKCIGEAADNVPAGVVLASFNAR